MTNKPLALLLLICASAIAATVVVGKAPCQPFEWWDNVIKMCSRCFKGYTADNYFQCEGNTISPYNGLSECIPCPKEMPVADSTKSFCMFADAPEDISSAELVSLQYQVQSSAVIGAALRFPDAAHAGLFVITGINSFREKGYTGPLNVSLTYTKSASPSETNYDQRVVGNTNATIYLKNPGANHSRMPAFFSMSTVETAVVYASFIPIKEQVQLHALGDQYVIDLRQATMFMFLAFEVLDVEPNSVVTATFQSDKSFPTLIDLKVFMSNNTMLAFPNDYHYDDALITTAPAINTSIKLPSTTTGLIRFGLSVLQADGEDRTLTVSVKSSK